MRSKKLTSGARPYRVDEVNPVYVQITPVVQCLDLNKWITREYLKLG
jgi:hypothetical protein